MISVQYMVLVLSSIENKNNIIESNTGLETPANFSATNRLDTRKTSNYMKPVYNSEMLLKN